MVRNTTLAIGFAVGSLLLGSSAFAQSATGGEAMAAESSTSAASSSASSGSSHSSAASHSKSHMGAHPMTGTITSIDDTGIVGLKTEAGDLKLHFPPSSLKGLKAGDKITVHLSFEKA